ncbi:MAG: hypothetical protein K2M31_02670 [Muribaculaceae bacterium]|nr:hypothetical protein [Muribaculaceae bacterium]
MKKNTDLRGTLHVTDWLSDISYIREDEETEIVQVLFKNTRAAFFRNPDRIPLKKGDWVTVEASPGHDIGRVMLTGPLVHLQMKKAGNVKDSDIKKIFRKASEADIQKFEEARSKEHTTMIRSRQIAADLGLNMKIGDVEYQGDGMKAIFYYIADERVDFRKLIRILADTFKVRIEMKQIGARQEAGRIGGIGPCGRPLCCSSWMSRFVSVGTGAARIQDLSMNPQKLAGQCGKLKCCLNFETDTYAEASKDFPPKDAVLVTMDQEYFQFKTDILARTITYSTDKHAAVNLVTISTDRAKEIIEINKRGEKPEQLEAEKVAAPPRQEYVELVGQDSLTRFDKKKKKKKGKQQSELKKENPSRKQKEASERKSKDNLKDNSLKEGLRQKSKDNRDSGRKKNPKDGAQANSKDSDRQKSQSEGRPKAKDGNSVKEHRIDQPKAKDNNSQKPKRNKKPASRKSRQEVTDNQPVPDNSGPVRKQYGAIPGSEKSQRK